MNDSILNTIKKMLGMSADYTPFDTDLVVHINGIFLTLQQLGVSSASGFKITGSDEEWNELSDDTNLLEAIKNYIYLKVRLVFDPPSSGTVADAFAKQIAEYEWRINVCVDPGNVKKAGE